VIAGSLSTNADLGFGPISTLGPLYRNDHLPNNGAFVASLTHAGVVSWVRQFVDPMVVSIRDIATGPDGMIVVVGTIVAVDPTTGSIDHGRLIDGFVAEFRANGDLAWTKTFPTKTAPSEVDRVAVDAHGDIVFAGSFGDGVDFGGGPVPATVPDPAISQKHDTCLVKLSSSGAHIWSRRMLKSPATVTVSKIAIVDGEPLLTGMSRDALDLGDGVHEPGLQHELIFLARYATNGTSKWLKYVEGKNLDLQPPTVAVDDHGAVYWAGGFAGVLDFGGGMLNATPASDTMTRVDGFLVKYAASGPLIWSHQLGPSTPETYAEQIVSVSGIAVSGESIVVTGTFGGTLALAGSRLSPPFISHNGFLASFTTDGSARWVDYLGHAQETPFIATSRGRDIVAIMREDHTCVLGEPHATSTLSPSSRRLEAFPSCVEATAATASLITCLNRRDEHGDDRLKDYATERLHRLREMLEDPTAGTGTVDVVTRRCARIVKEFHEDPSCR
jgi:hypothetical protein